jgi:hypothetical protein
MPYIAKFDHKKGFFLYPVLKIVSNICLLKTTSSFNKYGPATLNEIPFTFFTDFKYCFISTFINRGSRDSLFTSSRSGCWRFQQLICKDRNNMRNHLPVSTRTLSDIIHFKYCKVRYLYCLDQDPLSECCFTTKDLQNFISSLSNTSVFCLSFEKKLKFAFFHAIKYKITIEAVRFASILSSFKINQFASLR